jgi:hypothetical protein
MARTSTQNAGDKNEKKPGRIKQMWQVFTVTRQMDPAVVWWMLLAFLVTVGLFAALGLLWINPIYTMVLGIPLGLLAALVVMARRAEKAAFASIAGQTGGTLAALQNIRRGWNVEQEPVAVDPRTQDLVFRAVGRPGIVLVTEGPLPRANRLADTERKRLTKLMPGVPVTVLHAGDGEGQVPLRKLGRTMAKMRPAITKEEVSEVSKRLRALGAMRMPIPKGVDPMRARPDRKAVKGR